jgi:hypothetical protein
MIKSRRVGCVGHVAHMEKEKCVHFGWKSVKVSPLGRTRHRWEYNTKMDLKETGCVIVNKIYVAQGMNWRRILVNTAMKLRDPLQARNLLNRVMTTSFARKDLIQGNSNKSKNKSRKHHLLRSGHAFFCTFACLVVTDIHLFQTHYHWRQIE